ncbi:amino acid adenylation domain-containing protein [Paraburkholderia sp. NMBU_R16]|uniref:non-ribosomal peptide synthetase n=1 Tax=Paraburkholderia sp. NMBU_R16 TaxID=2698676 RepID=UPI001566B3B4|nr:non-ribosomal peptide synthetase [Paraburkholderia sp. NMBU_R16]NRO95024.1 amino acid adenylation domain-containing protein [Paraburkholderia sp. NMBU_R16]
MPIHRLAQIELPDSGLEGFVLDSDDGAFLALSAPQLEMWFAQQLEPDNPLIDNRVYVDICGPVDRAVFDETLHRLIGETEALHLRFVETPAGPKQYVGSPPSPSLSFVDVSREPNPFGAARRHMLSAAAVAYDLSAGPLFSQMLFKLDDAHHVWYQRYHHSVLDGASIPILIRRAAQIYSALLHGEPVPASQFGTVRSILEDDAQYRQSVRFETDRSYWSGYIADLPRPETVAGVPADRSGDFRRASVPFPRDAALLLREVEPRVGKWPLLMTAVVAAYLFRITNGRATVFDFPVSARPKDARLTPGMFANVVPLRLAMSNADTLETLTQRASAEVFRHLKHQQFRGKDIRRMQDGDTGPIFGPRINIIPFDDEWHFGGSPATLHSLANGLVHDLAVTLIGTPGKAGCMLHVDGNARLYDDAGIASHQQRLLKFIDRMLVDPARPIERIGLVDDDEHRLQIATWNATRAPYPAHLCMQQLVQAQAERTPDAVAVFAEAQRLSYAELNARANQLARHLTSRAALHPDTPIALCTHRSPAMVVAMLAVLKAGAAYVPIDPTSPPARIAHIVRDADPALALVDRDTYRTVHAACSAFGDPSRSLDIMEIDLASPPWAHLPADNIRAEDVGVDASHLAYIIYTSGSTGTPKGVMVEHRQLLNLVSWHIGRFELRPGLQVPCTAGLAFDACTWEIWPTLASGASLLLPPSDVRDDALALLHWWRHQSIECAFLVTPLALLAIRTGLPPSLRRLLIGGERLAQWPEHLPAAVELVNNYGPTEATVVATSGALSPADSVHPIGRPIANTRIYLLDERQRPVPIGSPGELYIGGASVARGYLNRPELTAERFVPDPFARAAGESGARMYRTGDLARYLPDGRLVFLGRNDDQLKIRGFRVEPAEIEAQLLAHPDVREAVVVAREDGDDRVRLVGYLSLHEAAAHGFDAGERVGALRAHLVERLPEYMLPAAFVVLEKMPLTANGKVDRRALPAPTEDAYGLERYEPPQGEIEIALARLWAELLDVTRVGRHDNFFSLGGHSLLAVQLIERLRQTGIGLPIRALFQHPTPAGLAKALAESQQVTVPENRIAPGTATITPDLLPLVSLAQAEIDRIVSGVPGGAANVQDIYPLSPLQEGILFHHLLSTQGDPYLLTARMIFADRATLDRYLGAIQQIVDRHDILRTAFVWEAIDIPVQVVYRHANVAVTELTLDPAAGPIGEQLQRRFNADRHRMDLSRAPLLHFVVAREPDARWHVLMALHHMVGDHTTLAILHDEVKALMSDRSASLAEPLPYRNLVAQARLGVPPDAHGAFFREMLGSVDTPTLPFGLTGVHGESATIAEARRMIAPSVNERLRSQARRLGVSLATLCHLAWAAVLARTAAQQRVVFGTVLFGRMAAGAGADRAMGLFINTLPLCVDIDDTDVEAAAREVQLRLAALLAHEHASLALAQRCSNVGSNAPLFSALLNYRHNALPPGHDTALAGVEFVSGEERTNYPVTLSVEDYGDALAVTVQVVDALSPGRICAYMQRALEQLADALEHRSSIAVSQLDVLPSDERRLLLDTWNATRAEFPAHLCLHELVEQQVRRTPDATAVLVGGQRLSYAELNTRANRLARHLIRHGVRPDVRVALCLQRSASMAIALLAVLKAGGAYVPLDPDYPAARLAHILRDANPCLLLVDRRGRDVLAGLLDEPGFAPLPLIELGDDRPHEAPWAALPGENLPPRTLGLQPTHLAYVIYTSGSTGMPKGVQNEHRALVNRLVWMQRAYRLQSDDVVLQKTPFSFDVSVWEFFWTLSAGATLLMAEPGMHRDADYLASLIASARVTTAHFVPSMLSGFLDAARAAQCTSLRRIVCSGEALPAATVHRLKQVLPSTALHNLYGPTEAAIDVTAWSCPATFDDDTVPIGKPIDNLRIYLLDARQQPVALGAVGELYIGGVGVARGYLNRPELNAERFLPDPFARAAGEPDARMYRTGDLARYAPDGNIVFLGRNDEQLKIRGFRIEPAEIETQLAAHESVREAVVIARENAAHEKRLIAYVTLRHDARDDALTVDSADLPHRLRQHLQRRLPDYMIPAAFVTLAALPLTPNGKLDRKALPAPSDEAIAHARYEPPSGETECAIARVWQGLLGVHRIGRHDNFFELGGHSILAVRMISRLAAETEKTVTLRAVFDAPTVATLATLVDSSETLAADTHLTAIDRDGALPLSFAEERVLAVEADSARATMLNASRLFSLRGAIRPECIEDALKHVVDRHEVLRTHYRREASTGAFSAVIGPSESWRMTVHASPGGRNDAMRLAQRKAARQPDCFTGPVFGATLFPSSAEHAVLVLSIHHIVMDAASWAIVWREFVEAYERFAAGFAPQRTPLTTQYRDYAAWERRQRDTARLEHLRRAWRERLAGAPVRTDLPFDRPRPAVMSEKAGSIERMLSPELVRQVRHCAASEHVTPFLVLETTFAILAAQLSKSREVVIGTVTEGRRHRDVEDMVGLFVNTIALRHRIDGHTTLSDHLASAARELVSALEVSELPFADIVAAINPPRAPSHDPVFQLFCQFQHGTGAPRTHVGGMEIEAVAREEVGRGADIAIVFQEMNDAVRLDLTYSADLFDPTTVDALVTLYLCWLSDSIQAPHAAIQERWHQTIESVLASPDNKDANRLFAQRSTEPGAWYAFSPAQQAVWLQEQSAPRNSPFFSVAAMRYPPTIDRERLATAARALIAQNQSFWLQWDSSGLQREAPEPTTCFERFVDPSSPIYEQACEAVIDWHRRLNGAHTSRIGSVALFEWQSEVLVALRSHHVQNDGWSAIKSFERIAENYAVLERNGTQRFEMDRLFLDTLKIEDRYLASPAHARDAAFWAERCRAVEGPPLVTLLADRPHATQVGADIRSIRKTLPNAAWAALARTAEAFGASPGECLTAISALYLSGVRSTAIGVSFLNRTKESLDVSGQFAKVIPLHVSFEAPNDLVGAALRHACHAFRDSLRHGRYPYGEMIRQAGLAPRAIDISVNTLFLRHAIEIDGRPAPMRWLSGPEPGLSFLFTQFGRTAAVDLELRFNSALFETATVSRHADRLLQFIERACEDLDRPVQAVELTTSDERRLLLDTWNATRAEFPAHLCLHELVEQQVRRTPDATAVLVGGQRLSYAELNTRANRLARHLIRHGVRPDVRVALCLQRSASMAIALLAVLKAGGAYVPLDPDYPAARLAHILRDANPCLLLVDRRGRDVLAGLLDEPGFAPLPLIELGDDRPHEAPWAALPGENLPPRTLGLQPTHLAYVIYTSGSTGMPKGVQNEHRALVNRLVWMQRAYRLQSDDVVLQKTPFSFDVSVWEFFWTLSAGATLLMAEPGMHRDADYLASLIASARVTTAHFVPSMLSGFLDAARAAQCTSLRRIVCSGEALPAATVHRLKQVLPSTALHNLYGPTEAAIDVTAWSCPATFDDDTVPIGKPIDNLRIYLLDARQQPVALGAVGELYIGGVGVARGYLNRPELNAERFLPDPFARAAGEPDARMYRTGDLARYAPDGNIVFLGRNDEQLKIRGFRIEPAEIETQLAAHESVREAVVIARENAAHEKRLIAYVTLRHDARDDALTVDSADLPHRLRQHLQRRLPDYMIPAAFVTLAALPLTPNGKLDRKALPAPSDEALAHAPDEAPQGALETALAALWRELLGVSRIGRHDNFFSLGGHSLVAVRMLNRLPASIGTEVPLSLLFEHPTLGDFASAVSGVLAEAGPEALPEIAPVSRDASLALSFAQQRLWFLAQLEGESTTYHVPLMLRLQGRLDRAAWRRALDTIWLWHEALRTVFPAEDGRPVARLPHREDGMPWREDDLSTLPAARTRREEICREEATRAFDLAQGPLVRARLIRLASDEHVFMLVQHHIVTDGWSIRVLVEALCELYRAAVTDADLPAPPRIQYRDYVAWQRQWLTEERLAHEARYWRVRLADAPVSLDLPTDRPRPVRQRFEAGHVPIRLDAATTLAVRQLAQAHGVTLFMLFAAAWAIVLARLSGQSDLVIGTPTANRPRPELESLAGLFVNTVALRIDLSGEPAVADLLARVRDTVLAAHAHQNLPFEQVVEIVRPPRRLDRTPVFQVMMAWQEIDIGTLALPNLSLAPVAGSFERAKFDLELDLGDNGQTISGALRYASALFDEATIARHCDYLLAVVQGMMSNARQPVSRIAIVGEAERRLLLETWNATRHEESAPGGQSPYPTQLCMHQLVEAQAARTPDAPAILADDLRLSYAELNARANRLAHHLRELGIQPDGIVALCARRSASLVVAMLAILKAGGAYLPIDPATPVTRIAHMLTDARPAAVLVDRDSREAVSHARAISTGGDSSGVPVIVELDAPQPPWIHQSIDNPGADARTERPLPEHLAYIVYTSGSTGTPKGVMIEHRQLVNLVCWHTARFELRPGSRVPCTAGLAFDACTWEIWPALASGAALLLPPRRVHDDALALVHWWRAQPIECGFLVTPLALLAIQAGLPPSLRRLLIGGEHLTHVPAELPPTVELVNNYGPTETTVVATSGTVSRSDAVHTIGRPIANTRAYLLDEAGEPVPIGAPGELYIGGLGVARGYLNRPELNAERFLPDPFARAAGSADARMFRTGDLARYLPDGRLVFLGRNDDQLKIRGFRVEPGEIEAQLLAHPLMREAVVLAHESDGEPSRLVAYVAMQRGSAASHPDGRTGIGPESDDTHAGQAPAAAGAAQFVDMLRTHLAQRLPEYMVPAAFVVLDTLPLTVNGKIDRRALPAPTEHAYAIARYESPEGKTEVTLAGLWAELLGLPRVGRRDNFFSLGGHSLLAVQMLAEVKKRLGIEASIRALFEAPTVVQFAERLGTQPASDALAVLLPLQRRGTGAPLFCIHPAGGFSWPYISLARNISDRPVYALQSPGLCDPEHEAVSIEAMAADYIAHVRTIQPRGPYHLLGWSLGCHIAHAMATQLQALGEDVARLVMLDGYPIGHDEALPTPSDEQVIEVLNHALADSTSSNGTANVDLAPLPTQSGPLVSMLGERAFGAVLRQFKRAPALAGAYRPQVYCGNVLFFRAAVRPPEERVPRSPAAWQPYVRGSIVEHDVACRHEAMMQKNFADVIGHVLAGLLNDVTPTEIHP